MKYWMLSNIVTGRVSTHHTEAEAVFALGVAAGHLEAEGYRVDTPNLNEVHALQADGPAFGLIVERDRTPSVALLLAAYQQFNYST